MAAARRSLLRLSMIRGEANRAASEAKAVTAKKNSGKPGRIRGRRFPSLSLSRAKRYCHSGSGDGL